MIDGKHNSIGERVRSCRRFRGMTLDTLAGLAGLSKGFLSLVENGKRPLGRLAHILAIAEALKVAPAELTGQPYEPTDSVQATAQAGVSELRLMLMRLSLGVDLDVPTPSLSEVTDSVREAAHLRRIGDYATLCGLLPAVISDLHTALASTEGGERAAVLRLVVRTSHIAAFTLNQLGHPDLAWIAAGDGVGAAGQLGEPAWIGLADFTRVYSLLHAGGRAETVALAGRAAEYLQGHLSDDGALQMYGMLHLTAAMMSARSRRADQAQVHLAEAGEVAARTGERGTVGLFFGPTNVAIHRVSAAVEAGDYAQAVQASAGVDASVVDSPSRQAAYYTDVGRALAHLRGHEQQAVSMLRRAEESAPQRVRVNPLVRETVAGLLDRSRRQVGGRDLRGLAWRVGVIG